MADPKKMSVADILAACRNRDGEGSAEAASAEAAASDAQPSPAAEEAIAPSSTRPTPSAKPVSGKKANEMSVAEMLAAARAEKSGGAQPAVAAKSAPATKSAPGAEKPAAGSKKPGQMSVQEMLAAARAEKAGGGAQTKPAASAKPKSQAASAKKASPKAPAKPTHAGPKETSSILAAARKADKPGPMSKAAAAAKAKPAAPPAKAKAVAPPMPPKPAYAKPKPKNAVEEGRRGFLSIFFGSFLAVGFSSLTLTNVLWGLGLARFFFPNILTEPPNRFKVGFPGDFAPGTVDAKFKAQFGIWLVNAEYEGQPQIVALRTVCTHLGCTPNWLEAEQKFKCPCHGSGFYKDGINFEGPAPRPLERYAISIADDGQLEVDKSKTFQEEMGQWSDPSSFVPA